MAQQPPTQQTQSGAQTATGQSKPLPPTAPGPANLDPLQKAVAQTKEVETSAAQLINGIAQHLKDLTATVGSGGSIPASEVDDLAQQLTDSANALAAAVKANTPAAPPASGAKH